jgi:hypothetical protein
MEWAVALTKWRHFSWWWAAVPFVGFVLYGLMDANYARHERDWEKIAALERGAMTESEEARASAEAGCGAHRAEGISCETLVGKREDSSDERSEEHTSELQSH